jgi:hypothetical protein
MPIETGSSILYSALGYMGQRLSTIMQQAGDEDKNCIASFHNEVVSVAQLYIACDIF